MMPLSSDGIGHEAKHTVDPHAAIEQFDLVPEHV